MNYVVLGVARDASYEAIRQAFRVLARQYHPDAGTGSSVERFRQVVDASETLRMFQREIQAGGAPQGIVGMHVPFFLAQTMHVAACNALHHIGKR